MTDGRKKVGFVVAAVLTAVGMWTGGLLTTPVASAPGSVVIAASSTAHGPDNTNWG